MRAARALRRIVAAAALLGAAACDQPVTGPTTPLGQEFVLAPGGSMAIEGASMTVRFDGVGSDSRCPADAICVTAGDALVRIAVITEYGVFPYDLHTASPASVQHEGTTVALIQLAPYPFLSRPIQPADYRATLRVTR